MIAPPIINRPKGWDLSPTNEALLKRIKFGAGWPYWVAGGSAANDLLIHFKTPLHFPLGLGFTDLVYAIGLQLTPVLGSASVVLAAGFDLAILAGFCALGYYATRRNLWAFVTAIVVLSLDTLLLIFFAVLTGSAPFVDLVWHAIALYAMGTAMQKLRIYQQRQKEGNA
jgi:hypothetical protein